MISEITYPITKSLTSNISYKFLVPINATAEDELHMLENA